MRIIREANEDWIYMKLHMFKRGLIDAKHVQDDLIFDLRDNGIVVLKFDDNVEYFKLFGYVDYQLHTLAHLFSSYSHMEYIDSYTVQEDWNEGYLYNYFNQENKELFEEIKNLISPELDLEENNDLITFCKTLDEMFNRRIDAIISDYHGEMDIAIEKTLSEAVREDLCNIFMTDGIYQVGDYCFYKYYTTVDNLIKIYDRFDDKSSDLYGILMKLGKDKGVEDNEYTDYYEYNYQDNFDEESFNRTVKWTLENLHNEILDSDKFVDLAEYKKIREYLNKFGIGRWNDLPKNKKVMFKIINVDPETNEIIYEYKVKNTQDFKKGRSSLSDFNLFLYHPELF